MGIRKSFTVLLALLILLLMLNPLAAQADKETIHPLLEMLGFVPSIVTTGSSFFDLSYIDYQAFEVASGISTPAGSDLDDSVVNDWLFYIGSHQVCPTR